MEIRITDYKNQTNMLRNIITLAIGAIEEVDGKQILKLNLQIRFKKWLTEDKYKIIKEINIWEV